MTKNSRLRKCFLYGVLLSVFLMGLTACSEISDAERIKNAEVYMAEGSYRAAVIELKNAIQTNSKNKDLRFLLGQVYLASREGANAEKELRRAKRLGIDFTKITVPLAQALMLQGMHEKALQILQEKGVEDNNEKIEILLLKGEIYLGLSDYGQAEKIYTEANELDPAHIKPILGLAKTSVAQGNISQAESYIEKANKISPDNISLILFRANLYSLKGMQAEAEADFTQALKLDKRKDFNKQKFQALTGMVTAQILQKNLTSASKNIKRLTQASPSHPMVKYLQGWLAFQKNDYELANTVLRDLQRTSPNYMPGLLLLGAANYALGNYEQANVHLSRFLNNKPEHIQARKLLAATQLKLNQPEKAMTLLKAEIKETDDADLIKMVGRAAALTGHTDAHISYLKNVIAKSPENVFLRKELAKAYMQQGSVNDAIVELESLHKKGSQDKNVDLLLIHAQLRAGNIDEAKKLAQEILQKTPSNPDSHTLVGEIEMLAGSYEPARDNFSNALKLKKNHISALLGLARVNFKDGKLAESETWFAKVLEIDKTSVAAILGQAQIAEQLGDKTKALSLLEHARSVDEKALLPRVILTRYYLSIKKADSALVLAKEVNSLQADSANSFLLLGRAYLLAGQTQDAANAYKKLVLKQPSAVRYTDLALVELALGELKSAHRTLKKALHQDSKYLRAKLLLIDLELKFKQPAKALKLAAEIKRQHKDKNIGALLEGNIYMQQKRYKQAQQAFQLANKIEPSAKLTARLSKAYFLSGEKKNAQRTLASGIKKYPDNFELRLMMATYQQLVGNIASSEHHYNILLEAQPSNIVVLNNLAALLTETNPSKAVRYAQQAFEQAPKSMAVADTYGWLLINNGELKQGLDILTDAVTFGDNPTVKYHLAIALAKNGKGPNAVKILEALESSGAVFAEQKEAAALLRKLK